MYERYSSIERDVFLFLIFDVFGLTGIMMDDETSQADEFIKV